MLTHLTLLRTPRPGLPVLPRSALPHSRGEGRGPLPLLTLSDTHRRRRSEVGLVSSTRRTRVRVGYETPVRGSSVDRPVTADEVPVLVARVRPV